jgi:hypothetical protein
MADQVQKMFKNIINSSEKVLNRALDNVYLNTSLKVFLALYAAFAAPKLPKSLVNLMDNTFTRIVFAFLIVLMAPVDPAMAIIIAVAFVVTLQTANKMRLYNTDLSQASPNQLSWLPSAKDNDAVPEVPQEQTGDESSPDVILEQPATQDNVVENMEGAEMPTSIENAASVGNGVFTTNAQFDDAQNNNVPGVNQDSCVKTWENQHCVQGLEQTDPNGYSGPETSPF